VSAPGRSELAAGIRDSLSLGLALVPIGLAFGYAAQAIGLSWWLAALMSALVYAGPSQFLVTELAAAGAGIPAMVATTFVANLRYTLFAASLAPHMRDAPPRRLLPLSQALADGSYAVVLAHVLDHPRRARKDLYLLSSFVVSFPAWLASSIAGAFLGDGLPEALAYGLDFATPAIFIAFLVPYLRDRLAVGVMLVAGVGTLLGNTHLPSGTGPLLAIVAASILGGFIRWTRTTR
jgi:4-azaleucine resistance transporter AzlC